MKPFERSPLTDALVNYLRTHDKGSQISYRELSKHVDIEIKSNNARLTWARHILERDHNAVWICIRPHVGVKRLNDTEIAERLPQWWMMGARKKLSRGGDQSETVEIDKLDIDQQARFAVDCVQQQLALESLSKATRRRMEKVARGTSNDLPAFNILEWSIALMPRKQST